MTRISEVIRGWRLHKELSLRAAARMMGIGTATLLRIEEGREPDLKTWLKIQNWLWKEPE